MLLDIYSYSDWNRECCWVLCAIGVEAVTRLEEVLHTGLGIDADDRCKAVFQADA